jgi:TatD DNase family protein
MPFDNLDKIITVGYDMPSSCFSVKLSEKHKDVYATVGVHPSDIKKMKDGDTAELLTLCAHPKTVAFGEIGLDYHYDNADPKQQQHWLLRQLDAVEQSGLPTVIHLRDAYEDMQKLVKQNIGKFRAPAVLHCFSGSLQTAQFYLSLGFYISFTGVITYPNAHKFTDIIRAVPRDRLLIETDCPYLTPQAKRGQLNYPAYVVFVAEKIAETLNLPLAEVAEITRQNAYNLFTKMKKE